MNRFIYDPENISPEAAAAQITEARNYLKEELSGQELIRMAVAPVRYVKSTIIEVVQNNGTILIQYMDEDNHTGYFDPVISLFSKFVKFADEEIQKVAIEYFTGLKEFYAAVKKQRAKEEYEKVSEVWEAKRKEEAVKEQEKKAEAMRQSLINCTEHLPDRSSEIKATNQFYVSLGYIAKHVKNVRAAMPDFLESWFVREFGDQPRYVVDSNKRTKNGFPMQWALSLEILLDTNDNIPAFLATKLSQQKKEPRAVANTEYVYLLASRFGIKFGKEQSLEDIRVCVPAESLADFEIGYSL